MRLPALAALAAAAMVVGPAANAQLMEPDADVEDIARTPLEVLNIDGDDVPKVLVEAVDDPYRHETLVECNDIVAEIALLDRALGADFDIASAEERSLKLGNTAKSILGSFIPFRGIISEVSGANDREARQRLAIMAGMVRRSYLKGLGQSRGCPYPARPSDARLEQMAASED